MLNTSIFTNLMWNELMDRMLLVPEAFKAASLPKPKEGQVNVIAQFGDFNVELVAEIYYDYFCIHRPIKAIDIEDYTVLQITMKKYTPVFKESGWILTHIPSGRRICTIHTKKEGVKCAKELRALKMDWCMDSVKELRFRAGEEWSKAGKIIKSYNIG